MKTRSIRAMARNRRRRSDLYRQSAFWDARTVEHASDDASMWPNSNLNRLYHREQAKVLDTELGDVEGARVLDIGCGTGRFSRHLADRGATVVGVDFSSAAIEVARKQSSGDNPRYFVQSMFELDEFEPFDMIFCLGVLTVACKDRRELEDALGGLVGRLCPGGRILVIEPIHTGSLHRVLSMDLGAFVDAMTEAGLKVERSADLHFWPVRLLLCYFVIPRFITNPGYRTGQWIMRRLGRDGWGDYKAITATRPAI